MLSNSLISVHLGVCRRQPFEIFNPYKPSILFVGQKANSVDPDQGLHCLLTECSIKV